MHLSRYLTIFISIVIYSACSVQADEAPLAVIWQDDGYNAETGYYDNTFVIKNISDRKVDGNWCIYYSQLPREIKLIDSESIRIELVNANFFRIYPTEQYKAILPYDSIQVRFSVTNNTPNISQTPEGCYWIETHSDRESQPLPVHLSFRPLTDAQRMQTVSPQKIYEKNRLLEPFPVLNETDILPTVKNIIKENENDKITIPQKVSLEYSNEVADEAGILREKIKTLYGIEVSEVSPVRIRLDLSTDKITPANQEQYKLAIGKDNILIEGITPHGVFNGVQTLLSLLKGQETTRELTCQTIIDYPDLEYRGLMFDIARNFTQMADLKKLIDVIASYKLNVLHLHLSDDEGWRLEIPGLEELTEVGAKRGHTKDEAHCLYPGYDGGYDSEANTTGNGYYSREDFIGLLKYAAQRHIRIIPEIESPGHARAAIVSMKARYTRYAGKDEQKAREYLLNDPEDTSVYISAQSYTDNVMNVALPSTYRFMEKVISEIMNMYKEAGIELSSVHIGGDEVPDGAWIGSPACRKFMDENNMTNAHELFEYYICRMADYLQSKNIKLSGWQEVALLNTTATDKKLLNAAAGIYCWNTVAEWERDEIPYHIANSGYPVVLCNVNNFYLDLAYDPHFEERGHSWGGYVDETKSFSVLPFSIYRSSHTDLSGNPIDLETAGKGKEELKKGNIQNIKGIQAQLFAETIRSFPWVEYYIFPKILGLVERGWNAHPTWETLHGTHGENVFDKDLSRFYTLISSKEMPYLNKQNINFRLPHPGLTVQEGYLYANSPLPGAQIRYTTDGTEPTVESAIWTEPIKCNASTIKARLFYLGKESVTTILLTDQQQ